MKTIYTLIFSVLITSAAFADTYYTYTATKSGTWSDMSVWSASVRTDGVHKTKVVVPAPFIVTIDGSVNGFGAGDVDINIMGTFSVLPSTTLTLSAASTISLFGTGSVAGTNNTEKIILGGVTKYDGSLDHTKTGLSVADAASGISPSGFRSSLLLPVLFTSFTAERDAASVILKWSTASEINNRYFEVQRSYNGNDWTPISVLIAAGNATATAAYAFTDNSAKTTVLYYRLKQVDLDGTAVYSAVKTVRTANAATAKIYSAGKRINIQLSQPINSTVLVTLLNTNGQLIKQQAFNSGDKLSLDANSNETRIVIVNVAGKDSFNQTVKLIL